MIHIWIMIEILLDIINDAEQIHQHHSGIHFGLTQVKDDLQDINDLLSAYSNQI